MNENELNIIADIFDAISGADEWSRRQMEDKCIISAEDRFDSVLEKARQHLPRELSDELDSAKMDITTAYGDAGIMYGIYVASVMRGIGTHSAELSERMNGGD